MIRHCALHFLWILSFLLASCAPLPRQALTQAAVSPTSNSIPTAAPTSTQPAGTATPRPSPTPDFFPSPDPLIYADSDGRVMRMDLASGETLPLSDPGTYQPGDLLQAYPFGQIPAAWTPVLSPDRRFLALPDPAGSGTWLVDLSGSGPARRLLDQPAPVTWSPDSQSLAWVDANHVYLQPVSGGDARELAAIEGLLNAAWSPRDESIAVVARGDTEEEITVALVNATNGERTELFRARAAAPTGRGFDLAWTEDGSEVWYVPAMLAYAVGELGRETALRSLLSPYVTAGERSTLYALSATPNQERFASPGYLFPDAVPVERRLQIAYEMFGNNRYQVTFEQPWSAYAWTEDGHNLLVQEGLGKNSRLWRINADAELPAYDLLPADAGEILASGALIGTLSHLVQYHRQIAPRAALQAVFEPGTPSAEDQWGRLPMGDARLNIEIPAYWNYNWPGYGDVASTLANFEIFSGYYIASLSQEWFYAHFDALSLTESSSQDYLEAHVFDPRANAAWQEIDIDGRKGYRVRWNDRPTHEEVLVLFDEEILVRIQKYPLHSDQDAVFERMLASAEWLPEDQWHPLAYPTETPNPTLAAAAQLESVGQLPAAHWSDPLALFTGTTRGEVVRATRSRIEFYDPADLKVLRTGLLALSGNFDLAALSADGSRLARAEGRQVEILDLNQLNEQGDPPVIDRFEAASAEVMKISLSPDGGTLAVVSQASRDDLGPAKVELYDTNSKSTYTTMNLDYVPRLVFSPDGRALAAWMPAGSTPVLVFSTDPAQPDRSPLALGSAVVWDAAAFSPDSRMLAAAGPEGRVSFWSIPDGAPSGEWVMPWVYVSDLAYAPDGRTLAIATVEGIQLRNVEDGAMVAAAPSQYYWINFVQREGEAYLAGLGSEEIRVWRIAE